MVAGAPDRRDAPGPDGRGVVDETATIASRAVPEPDSLGG
jgi:hypothetical protein